MDGAGRHDEQEISREVLRGAIANALVHREYNAAFAGQAVSIEIYPDCVVIKSPGGLWGGKTVENLANGESACRNSTLMSLMRFVSLSGEAGSPAEGNGMDIDLMLREMAVKSLPAPEFHAEIDSFTVTLGRHGTEIAEFRSWLASVGCSNLPQLERAVLLAVKQAGSITVKELHDRLGYDSDEIRTALKDLSRRAVLRLGDDDAYALSNVTADAENDKPQLGDVAGEQGGGFVPAAAGGYRQAAFRSWHVGLAGDSEHDWQADVQRPVPSQSAYCGRRHCPHGGGHERPPPLCSGLSWAWSWSGTMCLYSGSVSRHITHKL